MYWEKSQQERGLGIKQDLAVWGQLCEDMGWNNTSIEILTAQPSRAVAPGLGEWTSRLYAMKDSGKRPLGLFYYNGHSIQIADGKAQWTG